MDVFTMVVIIVTISCGAGMYNNYLKSQKHNANNNSDELLAELDALRERVEVLEKIVTDDKYLLHKEISELERSA